MQGVFGLSSRLGSCPTGVRDQSSTGVCVVYLVHNHIVAVSVDQHARSCLEDFQLYYPFSITRSKARLGPSLYTKEVVSDSWGGRVCFLVLCLDAVQFPFRMQGVFGLSSRLGSCPTGVRDQSSTGVCVVYLVHNHIVAVSVDQHARSCLVCSYIVSFEASIECCMEQLDLNGSSTNGGSNLVAGVGFC
ncbi:hypothetical protein M6B38_311615 [Iris pallida]|uniref:Uncharacterized protein n=1 Tax=Iris pallida TaxID=29817 RepID=A0AAX6HI44_IRIPA|nr:hypothetical protein M6B38_311615 [Iris pallida]